MSLRIDQPQAERRDFVPHARVLEFAPRAVRGLARPREIVTGVPVDRCIACGAPVADHFRALGLKTFRWVGCTVAQVCGDVHGVQPRALTPPDPREPAREGSSERTTS